PAAIRLRLLGRIAHDLTFASRIWNGPAIHSQPLSDVRSGDCTPREPAIVAILTDCLAGDRPRVDPIGQRASRLLATTPFHAVRACAGLLRFRGVDIQDFNALARSWEGRDFLDVLRNQTVWGELKQSFSAAELASIFGE